VAETKALLDQFNDISMKFGEPMDDDAMNKLMEKQAALQEKIDAAGAWELDRKLEIAADALRLPPWDADVSKLSGGERRRVALCQLLLSSPDMLLLDEPTNHLDAESVAWLERHLQQYKGTVIAVTHDRYFLDNVAEWILELDRGFGIPWRGNYSSWLEQKKDRLAREEKGESKRQRTLERELEWIHMSPRARQAKGKARLTAYEKLLSQEFEQRREEQEIYIPPGPRLGDIVIDLKEVSKGYGERLLIDNLDLSIPPGSIVGVIGPNGAGKTTLLRLITSQEQPDAGACYWLTSVGLRRPRRLSLDGGRPSGRSAAGGSSYWKAQAELAPCGIFSFLGASQRSWSRIYRRRAQRVHLAKPCRALT
jgi:ATPase subunit of ABC transporter with duplicated ATPase domains